MKKIHLLLVIITLGIIVCATISLWMIYRTHNYIFTDVTQLPNTDAAILLGCNKQSRFHRNNINQWYNDRLQGAVRLYKSGKVKHILISANAQQVKDFYLDLIKRGIPAPVLLVDSRGLRTYDSLARAKNIYHLNKVTLITETLFAYRALVLSQHLNLTAIVFDNHNTIAFGDVIINSAREYLARVWALSDMTLRH